MNQIIELIEEQDTEISREKLSQINLNFLEESDYFDLKVPANNLKPYIVRSRGYVGHVDAGNLIFAIQPKAPISNVFEMLEVVYKQDLNFTDGIAAIKSVEDIIQKVTFILAKRINDRLRKGIYREYLLKTEDLQFVRGRVNVRANIHNSMFNKSRIVCEFEELTPDIEDNQIILWALYVGNKKVNDFSIKKVVQSAYRNLLSIASLKPFDASNCIGRNYNRLNIDYIPLHNFSRLIIDLCGPSTLSGNTSFTPFSIYMPGLFERYVFEILSDKYKNHFFVKSQDRYFLEGNLNMFFNMDIVVRDKLSNSPLCVIDTKYKIHEKPNESDVQQIVAYCERINSPIGILVYPAVHLENKYVKIGGKSIFILGIDLEKSAKSGSKTFLKKFENILNI